MRNRFILLFSLVLACPVILAAQSLNTAKIDQLLGHSGQKTGDVYRVGFQVSRWVPGRHSAERMRKLR